MTSTLDVQQRKEPSALSVDGSSVDNMCPSLTLYSWTAFKLELTFTMVERHIVVNNPHVQPH